MKTPNRYTSLAELMLLDNGYAYEAGLPAIHTADDIAEAWRTWVTEGDLRWSTYYVPEGFLTDFASIPAIFRWLFAPNGAPHQVAAVLHDWLYASDPAVSRKEADLAYYWLARAMGTSEVRAAVMYAGLRVGGWLAFMSNRRKLADYGPLWRMLDGPGQYAAK